MNKVIKETINKRADRAALVTSAWSVIGSTEYISELGKAWRRKTGHSGVIYLSPWVTVGGAIYRRDDSEMVLE